MPEYRKRKNSDTWHWCTNCSNWPTLAENPDVRSSKPAAGGGRDLCDECKAKTKLARLKMIRRARTTLENLSILRGLWLPVVIREELRAQSGQLPDELVYQAKNPLLDNPEDLTRFDAFLREIGDRAATQGEPGKDSWTDLKSRLSKPGYINGYRPLASAVLEAIALGVLLAEWNDAVELWPPVPRRTGHSDALVLAEPPLNCEVTCRWSDQDLARRDFSPRRMTGAQTGADAYWDKLTRAAAEKSEQMRSDMLNVLFMAALFEYDPRLLEEDGAETAESILARSSQKLGRSGKRVVVFDFDGTLKLARTYAPPDLQPDEAVVIDKLRAAFTSHWPSPRAVECKVLPTGLWDALSLPQDIRRRKTY